MKSGLAAPRATLRGEIRRSEPLSSRPTRWAGRARAAFLFAAIFLSLTAAARQSEDPLAEVRRQFDAGHYQQAVDILRTALAQNERDAAMQHWLGRSYFELHDFEHAVASAERAIALAPKSSEYHQWLGKAYGRRAEQAGFFGGFSLARKAHREFQEAVRLDPRNFSAQQDLIEFLMRAPGIVGGGDDKARQQIQELAALDAAEAHAAWGAYWSEKKKPDQAATEYRQVFEAKAERVDIYLEAADFYIRHSDAAGLDQATEAAARVAPADLRLNFYRGVALVLAGNRLADAETLLKNYLDTAPPRSDFPSPSHARQWLGYVYEKQGRRPEAAEQYRIALRLDPRNKVARDALKSLEK